MTLRLSILWLPGIQGIPLLPMYIIFLFSSSSWIIKIINFRSTLSEVDVFVNNHMGFNYVYVTGSH